MADPRLWEADEIRLFLDILWLCLVIPLWMSELFQVHRFSMRGLSSLLVGSSPSPASSCWKLLLLWLSPQRWSSCHLFTRHLPGRNEFYNPSQKHWAKEWLSQLPSATPRPTVYHGSPNETSRDRNGLKVHHSPRFDPSLSPRRGCYESSPPHPQTVKTQRKLQPSARWRNL